MNNYAGRPWETFMKRVTPVLKVLRQNVIDVVAIHHHMTGTSPTIHFLHYLGHRLCGQQAVA